MASRSTPAPPAAASVGSGLLDSTSGTSDGTKGPSNQWAKPPKVASPTAPSPPQRKSPSSASQPRQILQRASTPPQGGLAQQTSADTAADRDDALSQLTREYTARHASTPPAALKEQLETSEATLNSLKDQNLLQGEQLQAKDAIINELKPFFSPTTAMGDCAPRGSCSI